MPQHGDLVALHLGPQRAWMVCHPESVHHVLKDSATFDKGGPLYDRLGALMGEGLVTCRQDTHRRKRRVLQPAFRRSRVTGCADLIAEEAEATCRSWQPGQDVRVSAEMTALTTRVISRVLLSDSLDEATAAEVRDCLTVIVRGLFVRTIAPVDALFRLPLPANRRYRRAVDRVHAIIDAAIAERTTGPPRDDVLGALLAAGREDGARAQGRRDDGPGPPGAGGGAGAADHGGGRAAATVLGVPQARHRRGRTGRRAGGLPAAGTVRAAGLTSGRGSPRP
ncbi:cytochrome P450 [Streptomyces sp. NPDC017943]|uniref:cytochrome P450 n=1 Tax=Streptomyces sp. NPDC017943 TaxID=3365019 RepID=UPI00379E6DD5